MVGMLAKEGNSSKCCKCGEKGKFMLSLYGPGDLWMCTDCIEEREERTGLSGIFCYWKGLVFVDKEGEKRLEKESQAIKDGTYE